MINIIGPTASGKTSIAVQLAHLLGNAPIISADSRQVYRGMNIGTGKDLEEYRLSDGTTIPYYMIDICEAGERYNLYRYLDDVHHLLPTLPPYTTPVVCGGSGLYAEALIRGYQLPAIPENSSLREKLNHLPIEELQEKAQHLNLPFQETHNPRRLIRAIEIETFQKSHPTSLIPSKNEYAPLGGPIFCITPTREARREKISARLLHRLQNGMIEEVEGLLQTLTPDQLIYYGLEYKYVTEYITGKLSYNEMHNRLEIAIHQFAKRQMTWIRGMEKRGLSITYITPLETPLLTAQTIYSQL